MNPFQSYRFFHGMRIRHLALLMKGTTETSYQPGEILFNQGDPVRHFFLIKTGVLALCTQDRGKTRVIKTARSGDVLGWSCLDPEATWHSSGQALEDTTVTILDASRLLAEAKENPEFGCELLRRAAQWDVERLESDNEVLKINVAPLAVAAVQPRDEMASENSSHFALTLSPSDAKQLSVHDGQWVLLTDQHGSAILPVRIKPELKQNDLSARTEVYREHAFA